MEAVDAGGSGGQRNGRRLWSETNLPCLTSLWWVGDLPAGGFWRPLPGLVLQASLSIFGEAALPLHLLAILLHGSTAALLAILTTRLVGDLRLGFLAALFFVACEDLSMVVGWVTTLSDVLCGLFVVSSLLAHLTWMEHRRFASLCTSILALVLALGCKASAVAASLGLAALTAVIHVRRAQGPLATRIGLRSAWRDPDSWVPGLVLFAVYLVAYLALGFGFGASPIYADPFSQPLAFLRHLVVQLPVLWLATFGLFLVAMRPFRRDPVAWWALIFYLLALVPQGGAEGGERALYLALLPAGMLLALLAAQGGVVARRWLRTAPAAPRLSRFGAQWVFAGALLPGVVLSPAYALFFTASFGFPGRQVKSLVELVQARRPEHVVVLNTSGPFLTFYLGDELSWRIGHRVDTRVLSALNGVMTVERTAERSITLRTDRRGWLTNAFALLPRTSTRLAEGQAFPTDPFTATIVDLAPGDRMTDALAVRFDFSKRLDDPRMLFATWTGEAFVDLDLAALPLGERRQLADSSDLWDSMR